MNAVLYGYAKNGVPWVKTPRNLMIALVSSLATFFLWPILCESMAQERLRRIQDMAKSRSWWDTAWYRATNPISFTASSPENITRAEFVAACEASAADEADSFYKTIWSKFSNPRLDLDVGCVHIYIPQKGRGGVVQVVAYMYIDTSKRVVDV